MKVMIFNDTQNFNGSLNFINDRFGKSKKRFWDYNKYIPFLIKKVKSLDKFNNSDLQLVKTYFYEGRYSSNLMGSFKWTCNQKISELNRRISKEKILLNLVSQASTSSRMLKKAVNKHVKEIIKDLAKGKDKYSENMEKQKRNFEGQRSLLEALKSSPLIDTRLTPLKQSGGENLPKRSRCFACNRLS